MIKKFRHKGLKKFYDTGSKAGIMPHHERRLRLILARLDAATCPEDMNLPGLNFHGLIGDLKGFFSVAVHANWKVIFQFKGADAYEVDYLDYH